MALISLDEFQDSATGNSFAQPDRSKYEALLDANQGRYAIGDRVEMAMFLAHVLHETGGYVQLSEDAKSVAKHGQSYDGGPRYCGRGYIQLTHRYNYAAAGHDLGLDLVNQPEMVAQDESVAWRTAFWFWATSVRPQDYRFGATTRSINSSECTVAVNHHLARKRFRYYCNIVHVWNLDIDPDERGCYS